MKSIFILLLCFALFSCKQQTQEHNKTISQVAKPDKPEYFFLRPELEKKYGYTQAVKVGNLVKIVV